MSRYKDFDDDYEYEEEYEETPYRRSSRYVEEEDPPYIHKSRYVSDDEPIYAYTKRRNYEYYEEEYEEEDPYIRRPKRPANKKKRKRRKLIAVMFVVEFLLAIVLLGVWYLTSKLEKIEHDPIDRDAIMINNIDDNTKEILSGYKNILLLGSDARNSNVEELGKTEENHTDAMLILSINVNTKEARLVSVYRDMIMRIPIDENNNKVCYNKATEAMYYYGAESTINMLNTNLDLDITDYVLVNWEAVIQLVDAVGGIDGVVIDEEERYWINQYMADTAKNTGRDMDYPLVEETGSVHLNGLQATAYCRIRATQGWDYRRTERQRTVITKIFEKVKKFSPSQINKVLDAVCSNILTSISNSDLISLAMDAPKYQLTKTGGFPFETIDGIANITGLQLVDPVLANNLSYNVSQLHKYLFDVNDYSPSYTVQEISREMADFKYTTYDDDEKEEIYNKKPNEDHSNGEE